MNNTRALAFGGLLAAIHLIAAIAVEYLPGLDLFLIFILPFFSVMYVLKVKATYVASYAIATFIIALIFNPPVALLYILPSLIVGILYGYLVKVKTTSMTLIYILAASQLITFFLSCFSIQLLYGIDVISSIQHFFKIDLEAYRFLGLPLLVIYCFAQAFLLHIILKSQLKKFKIRFEKTPFPPLWFNIAEFLLLAAMFSGLLKDGYLISITLGVIIFGIPFVLYAFQQTSKTNILFFIMAFCFLVVSIPLTKIYNSDSAIPYISMFVPVALYGMWLALKKATENIRGDLK